MTTSHTIASRRYSMSLDQARAMTGIAGYMNGLLLGGFFDKNLSVKNDVQALLKAYEATKRTDDID